MKKLFGTDGIRGKAGEYPLDPETVSRIGDAFAEVFTKRLGRLARFVTGRDTRESGPAIEAAFHQGAALGGAEGESAGVITTPSVAYVASKFGFDAGIVVSASHNPYLDNGIKIFLPSGQKLDEVSEREIESMVLQSKESVRINDSARFPDRSREFSEAYLHYLRSNFEGLDLANFHVVADCANGAASDLAELLFGSFGAKVSIINSTPNGRNINHDCGSLHLEKLQAAVTERKAGFGVAFDGDADRALFVDETGSIVDGDATLWILANQLKMRGELVSGKVVATVMSNIGLELAFRDQEIELDRTPVGDKYVLEELIRSGAEIGGEQSGHIILPKKSLVGDGMMTALLVLQALSDSETAFSELHKGFVRFPQILLNVPVVQKVPFDSVPSLVESAKKVESELGETGRLLLRYSGTENLARVMIEGRDQDEIGHLAKSLAEAITRELG